MSSSRPIEDQRRYWGDHMLNGDASICRFGEVPEQLEPFFLRPVHDTKAFTGVVTDDPGYTEPYEVSGSRTMP